MEPEEENIGMMNILGDNFLLTRDYGEYRVTNGGITVNPYVDNDYGIPSTCNRMYNKDGELMKKGFLSFCKNGIEGFFNDILKQVLKGATHNHILEQIKVFKKQILDNTIPLR